MRLLDVACGQGRVARDLARRGARITGVDISAALLAKARAQERAEPLGIGYLHADATDPRVLAGQVFDGAVCNHGLSDIDDLDGVLATIARVVRAGGLFVFSLLHPCFPGWDRDAPSSWPPDRGYYWEGWWLAGNPGFRGKVGRQPPAAVHLSQRPRRARAGAGRGRRTGARPRLGTAAARRRSGAAVPGRPVPAPVAASRGQHGVNGGRVRTQ